MAYASTGVGRVVGRIAARPPAADDDGGRCRARTRRSCAARRSRRRRTALGRIVLQVCREAGGRADDDGAVHPVGAAAERTAQPGGAELEHARESVGQVGDGRGVPALGSQRRARRARPGSRGRGRRRPRPRAAARHIAALRRDGAPTGIRHRVASAARDRGRRRRRAGARSGRRRTPGLDHLLVDRGVWRDAGRGVGHQRDAEHLQAALAGGDRLQRWSTCPTRSPPMTPGHPHLGRGLVVRPAELDVDALVERPASIVRARSRSRGE